MTKTRWRPWMLLRYGSRGCSGGSCDADRPRKIRSAANGEIIFYQRDLYTLKALNCFDWKGTSHTKKITMWNLRKELKNLILCLIDAARADHLSCYRYSISTTPGIDKIASEGILFENTFSQIPSTLPAVTSLFTSFYAEAHQVLNKHCRLSKEAQTLAKLFKESGFRTAAFSANSYVSRHYGLHNGFLKFEEIFTQMEHT